MKTGQMRKKNLLPLGKLCLFNQLKYTGKITHIHYDNTIRTKSITWSCNWSWRSETWLKKLTFWITQSKFTICMLSYLSDFSLVLLLHTQLCLCKCMIPNFIRKWIKYRDRAESSRSFMWDSFPIFPNNLKKVIKNQKKKKKSIVVPMDPQKYPRVCVCVRKR